MGKAERGMKFKSLFHAMDSNLHRARFERGFSSVSGIAEAWLSSAAAFAFSALKPVGLSYLAIASIAFIAQRRLQYFPDSQSIPEPRDIHPCFGEIEEVRT